MQTLGWNLSLRGNLAEHALGMSEEPYVRERALAPARKLRDEVARGSLCGKSVNALPSDGMTLARRTLNSPRDSAPLSPRGLDVLRTVSRGAANKEAARELRLAQIP